MQEEHLPARLEYFSQSGGVQDENYQEPVRRGIADPGLNLCPSDSEPIRHIGPESAVYGRRFGPSHGEPRRRRPNPAQNSLDGLDVDRNHCTLGCVQCAVKEPPVAKRSTRPAKTEPGSIGEKLRTHRVEVLEKSLRDMAKVIGTAPIHLSDIETGRRSPSEELLLKMAKGYGLPESELRSGFGRPDVVVAQVASESAVAAEKVPEFLRTARGLTANQWDKLIHQAQKMTGTDTEPKK
jgi:transcriptional regulator with XRE-family HTH domain